MLNSEETKPVAIAIIELCLSKGIVNCPIGSSSPLTTVPGHQVLVKIFLLILRSNINKALILKFLILGQGRGLVCRGILHVNYLPLSHMWVGKTKHLDIQ